MTPEKEWNLSTFKVSRNKIKPMLFKHTNQVLLFTSRACTLFIEYKNIHVLLMFIISIYNKHGCTHNQNEIRNNLKFEVKLNKRITQ